MKFPESPGPGWIENTGTKPEGFERTRIFFRKGSEPHYDDRWNPMSKPGWGVETTRWSLRNDPHDVAWYLPLH